MAYRTVAGPGTALEVIKGSRFLGSAAPIGSAEDARGLLDAARREHPDATHHCWAYRLGEEMRFSDDGEPGGTAGRPMLEVLLKRDLDRVNLIVVRYFGGTQLGAGGLVRAYSGTAAKALDAAGEVEIEDRVLVEAHVGYPFIDGAHRLLAATRDARLKGESYDAAGWQVAVELPSAEAEGFRVALRELTRGSATVEEHEVEL